MRKGRLGGVSSAMMVSMGVVFALGPSLGGGGCASKDPLLNRSDAALDQGPSETQGSGGTPVSTGGAAGAGIAPGSGCAPGSGSGGGGLAGAMGQGGAPASGGTAGQSGGPGSGGAGSGLGGAGGLDNSACKAIDGLSRSCTTASDCTVVIHRSNCCGTARYMGINASEAQQFGALEPTCAASYPRCGCATQAPILDDGSSDSRMNKTAAPPAAVTCLAGTCTTYVAECKAPCAAGTKCFSCQIAGGVFAACTTECLDTNGSSDCKAAALPLCQSGTTGNIGGTYCTAAGVACDKK